MIRHPPKSTLFPSTTLFRSFATVKKARPAVSIPLVAMVSYSITYRYGMERFIATMKEAGFDGLILPDLPPRSEEHTSELQSQSNLVCRLLLEKKNTSNNSQSGNRAIQCPCSTRRRSR